MAWFRQFRITGKLLLSMFVILWFSLFITIYLMWGTLVNRANCAARKTHHHTPHPVVMMNDASSLGSEEFIEKYLTLSDRGPGDKVGNFFLSKNEGGFKNEGAVKMNILIGVITAEKYLLTRAVTIYRTWAQGLRRFDKGSSLLYFFVGENCRTDDPLVRELPIIKLKGIRDDIYPPQDKVFAVLEYMHSRFGEKFKWFIRADDDVYIHMGKLEALLNGWEWTEELMLGHPGYGLKDDRKRLKLLPEETYCMGGPGVVFSSASLKALSPHLGRCLKAVKQHNEGVDREVGWFNEDVELGRCVSRTVGIGCSQVAQDKYRFFPDYKSEVLNYNNLARLEKSHDLITIHPVKDPKTMFSVHHFYETLKLASARSNSEQVLSELKSLCAMLANQHVTDIFTGKNATDCSKLLSN